MSIMVTALVMVVAMFAFGVTVTFRAWCDTQKAKAALELLAIFECTLVLSCAIWAVSSWSNHAATWGEVFGL